MRRLFRPEAIEAQRQSWLGGVQVVRPPSLAVLTVGIALVAAALATFLATADYTRKATVAGVLVPDRGLIRLSASAAGTVLERRAAEGQSVQAGEVLFVVELDRPELDAAAQSQVRRSLDERARSLLDSAEQQSQFLRSQQQALDRRLQSLAAERAQIDTEIALQRQRLALAEQALQRLESLAGEQFISSAQVQAKAEEVLALKAQASALQRQRSALAREAAELEGERTALPITARGARAGIERDLAVLSREAAEQDAQRRIVVRAPQAGTVSAMLVEPGQGVAPGTALASLVPAGATLQAHLYAPSSAVGFVQPGQAVRLRYEAFPYQKFGQQEGRVLQVSRAPLSSRELAAVPWPAADGEAEPLFRITVALEGAPPGPLVAGMRTQADVRLDRRRLAEWLFAPLAGWAERQELAPR